MRNELVRFMKILIVDDEPVNLDILNIVLKNAGHTVITATSGEIALKLFDCTFDILITDLSMPPGMNGGRLIEDCRKFKKDLKTILMSADLGSYNSTGLTSTPDYFMKKPLYFREVFQALDHVTRPWLMW
jgi:two-component system, OmpR family, response regulator